MEQEWQNLVFNIKWIRKQYGISKKNMASLLEIGIQSLNKIENGETPPRLSSCIFTNIRKYFGIRPIDQLSRRLGTEHMEEG